MSPFVSTVLRLFSGGRFSGWLVLEFAEFADAGDDVIALKGGLLEPSERAKLMRFGVWEADDATQDT